jgi:hypothetical protein
MPRIERPSIQADIGSETVRLDKRLRGVVAAFAQALKRTKPEFVDLAAMWLDVIADFRRRDDTALETERTKRLFAQLMPSDSSPASRGVPLVPLRRLAANAHGSTYHRYCFGAAAQDATRAAPPSRFRTGRAVC